MKRRIFKVDFNLVIQELRDCKKKKKFVRDNVYVTMITDNMFDKIYQLAQTVLSIINN